MSSAAPGAMTLMSDFVYVNFLHILKQFTEVFSTQINIACMYVLGQRCQNENL